MWIIRCVNVLSEDFESMRSILSLDFPQTNEGGIGSLENRGNLN
jgi:hypothetical protein